MKTVSKWSRTARSNMVSIGSLPSSAAMDPTVRPRYFSFALVDTVATVSMDHMFRR